MDCTTRQPSLFQTCLQYITCNISMVESLVGFPELIGQQLFDAVVASGQLATSCEETNKVLALFQDAYEQCILHELVLRDNGLLANCYVETWLTFSSLRKLDLTGCALGDGHDLIMFFSQLVSLTHLSVCDNCLSSSGIQNMTASSRVLNRGPIALLVLDLSCNPRITDKALTYIEFFRKLQTVNLSGTAVTEDGIRKFCAKADMKKVDRIFSKSHFSKCSQGWATGLVAGWVEGDKRKQLKLRQLQKKEPARSALHAFYSRRTHNQVVDRRVPLASPHIVLTRAVRHQSSDKALFTGSSSSDEMPVVKWTNKRRMVSVGAETSDKRRHLQQDVCDQDELDIMLSGYLPYTTQP